MNFCFKGKSSLLNAFIGFDLLPSDHNRCTYTTTEIRSCREETEQKYEIEYFSEAEFQENTNRAETQTNATFLNYFNDVQETEEITRHIDKIRSYLGKAPQIKAFTKFDQVRAELRSAIATPEHARAVKKIVIWTSSIGVDANLVFYDVPGYDSPITLHKEQTRAKIASVDAVLYAKTVHFCGSCGTHDQLV